MFALCFSRVRNKDDIWTLKSDIAVKVNVKIIDAYVLLLDIFDTAKEEIIMLEKSY